MYRHRHPKEHLPFQCEPACGCTLTDVYYCAFFAIWQKKKCIGEIKRTSVDFLRNRLNRRELFSDQARSQEVMSRTQPRMLTGDAIGRLYHDSGGAVSVPIHHGIVSDSFMFWMDKKKTQPDDAPTAEALPAGVIVSPDAHRANRLPPGQSRTKKWPVLDAGGPPPIDLERWTFRISGLVETPVSWNWREFQELPRVKVFSDFHCVTRWSRLGNIWEGPSTRELISRAGGSKPEARFVLVHGYDGAWTTNLPLEDFLAEDALIALLHDGEPLGAEHGGPARLIVPRLYAWKSAKWVAGVELLEKDRAGFWEKNGYHMRGDPWAEERYRVGQAF